MKTPLITIIIPIYNNEKYMKSTMESLLSQTYKHFEILCIDDLSADNSVTILEEYASKDPRVVLIRRTSKANFPTPSIILGVEKAKGDYFFYLSQDDLLDADFLEKTLIRALEIDADAVSSKVVIYHENKPIEEQAIIDIPNNDHMTILSGRQAFEMAAFYQIGAYALVKMDLVKKIGFDTLYFDSCDYAVLIRFLNANKVAFANTRFYYRQDNMNAINKRFRPYMLEMILTGCRVLEVMKKEGTSWSTQKRFLKRIINNYSWLIDEYTNHYHTLTPEGKKECMDNFVECYQKLTHCILTINPLYFLKLRKLQSKIRNTK